jgi:uncharacterized protein (TIGR03032 family)
MAQPPSPPAAGPVVRTAHSVSFPPLLRQLGVSLFVTTYQAGKLLVLRPDGDIVNALCRDFESPMGLAYRGGELVLGTRQHVWTFLNNLDVVPTLQPPGRHDACFLPRQALVTGDIQVHEMAWAAPPLGPSGGDEGPAVWIANTRFSCLSTLDGRHSFVPRWRPPFVTRLAAEDRCHLNGLGVRDGRVRYVTCLGPTDTAAGWRANKADGGCLLDVPGGEVIARGLSMPHSPRWYQDRLWVLESGDGSLAIVEERTGRREAVARLPGFTRGLDFFRGVAFIGLSQVRESAVFSGLPITRRPEKRVCGVWAVEVATGRTLAFLEFQEGVQEIFAVQALPGYTFPELITDDPAVIGNSFLLPPEATRPGTEGTPATT